MSDTMTAYGGSMDPNLRNFKDFISLYNKLTAMCFENCVDTLSGRDTTKEENECVNTCVTKYARFNQQIMSVYIEVQTAINQRRIDDAMEQQKQQEAAAAAAASLESNILQTPKIEVKTAGGNINPL